jgi:hypothetical protein
MVTKLEDISGYSGNRKGTLSYHPLVANSILLDVGCTLLVQDINGPHKQVFMRIQDEEITCVSADGRISTSLQLGFQSS